MKWLVGPAAPAVIVAIAAAAFLARALLAEPDYGRRPRLAAVVDGGKMEEFVETADEKETILRWVDNGAAEPEWPLVATVFEERCTTCHYSDASFEVLPLDDYAPAAASARVQPVLLEKITGGTMGKYFESPEAQAILVAWIEAGAREPDWPSAKEILDEHCIHCHNPEGVQGIVSLDNYRSVARLASLPEAAPRPLTVPGIALVVSLAALVFYRPRA